ncbi:hypothetical protein RhiirA1_462378 [Rhizophagus irregularis]|uniref:Uncharacterized protein n=1 Tax=Rhizophagus irregularis TaxID=588596 RepID=A0A2N0RMD5_9GLOM|nr:hypothetical protein RhiirA1_462378 [Rhizophagus irregularis]
MNDKEFDMNDKEFDMNDKEFDMNDKELNENSSLFSNITQEYKIPLPFAIIFILAGLFILVFSFVVNVECPKDKPNCDLREKTAQQLAPILISYGFLFVALTCLYSAAVLWSNVWNLYRLIAAVILRFQLDSADQFVAAIIAAALH